MDFQRAMITGPRTDFLELARKPSGGKMFRKQILSFGSVTHPNDPTKKLKFDRKMAERVVENFKNGVVDIVQVPVVDDKNRHSEDPLRNIGEVIDLAVEDDGLYGTIDVRKPEAADAIGKTLLGASAMLHLDYEDVRLGKKVGPTLLHMAITNRPYITNLKDFEAIAASADTEDEKTIVLTDEEEGNVEIDLSQVSREDLIEALREEHDVDVEALQSAAEAEEGAPSGDELTAALANVLSEAGVIELSGDGENEAITIKDVADAVIELSNEKMTLEASVEALQKEAEERKAQAAADEVQSLIDDGKILPKQRDAMIKLAREDRETFEALVPEDSLVELSERGVTTHEAPDSEAQEKLKSEVDRYVELAREEAGRK